MRKNSLSYIGLIILALFTAAGCGSASEPEAGPCTNTPVGTDSTALLSFAKGQGLTNLKDTLGMYYQVLSQGSGATPTVNSKIFITYTGTLLNGTIFDSKTNAAETGWPLAQLIAGWQYGLTKIQAGGHIKLLIPSAYGYGCQGSGAAIPPNSPLYFDITLVSIQ
jgi:FKBP-type peptidyl-prolyl cis-trans isomerase